MNKRKTCRSCGCANLTQLFTLGEQCVSDFVPSRDAPVVRCPISIVRCPQCSLVQQEYTAPSDFMYTRHYWYRSGTTQTMQDALADVAEQASHNLPRDAYCLDIGSNDGTFIRALKKLNPTCYAVGVEPATNLTDIGRQGADLLINDFWSIGALESAGLADKKFHLVTALGMFYDLEDPNQFIRDVAYVLHPEGTFVAQLMCARQMYDNMDIGNLCHEHLEFYTIASLRDLFGRYGLQIVDLEQNDVTGGSYRLIVKHRNDRVSRNVIAARKAELDMGLLSIDAWYEWYRRLQDQRALCLDAIHRENEAFRNVWVYGASTKGNVILQWYGLSDAEIAGAVDKSPEKHGKYTVGSNIEIHPESAGRDVADRFLVLPYAFSDEFKRREHAWLARGGKFLVPLPEFRYVEV